MADVASRAFDTVYRAATEQVRAGDLDSAEREVLRLLDQVEDEATRLRTLGLLAAVYTRAGRMFESLAIARYLAVQAHAGKKPRAEFTSLSMACTSLYGLYINADRRDLLARMDELLAEIPTDEHAGCHLDHAYCHLGQALDDDDMPEARRHLQRLKELAPHASEVDRELATCARLANEAIVELHEGDPDRALEVLDELDRRGVAEPHHAPELTVLRVRAQVARGALEDARDAAAFATEALEGAPAIALSECILYGAGLAEVLDLDLNDPAGALHVYDITATAVVRRILQLDESLRRLQDLRIGDTCEKELVRYRLAFRKGQRRLLDRVGVVLRAQAGGGTQEVLDRATENGLIPICAWCESVRTEGGNWMPFGQYLPRDGSYLITSTICPPCRAELL